MKKNDTNEVKEKKNEDRSERDCRYCKHNTGLFCKSWDCRFEKR